METNDDLNSSYPLGYEYVERSVSETIREVHNIDRQIETTPQSSRPVPTLKPRGFATTRFINRERTVSLLEAQKESVQAEAWGKIEKETTKPNDKAARVARDTARQALFPNPYRNLNKEERKAERGKSRDIQMSQDYMDAERLEKASERMATPQPENPTVGIKGEQAVSASERYSKSFKCDFSRQGREMTEPSPDRGPDRDLG
ncbi:hypothetical protein [Spirosoma pulveris]